MNTLRPSTWLMSFALHGLLLVPLIAFSDGASYDSGSGSDAFNVEQGIALEGLSMQGDAQETVEAVDVPPVEESVVKPVEEVQPVDQVIASSEISETDSVEVPPEEPKEIIPEEPQPKQITAREQLAEVAAVSVQASSTAREAGQSNLFNAYLGKLRTTLERHKVNPRSRLTGTVVVKFTVAPTGAVLSREVQTSSGSKILDEAAVAALDRASPFPPMPTDISANPMVVSVPFKFLAR